MEGMNDRVGGEDKWRVGGLVDGGLKLYQDFIQALLVTL